MSVHLGPQYILAVLLVTNTNLTKRSLISLALVLSKCLDPLIHLPSISSSSSTEMSIWFPKPLLL